MTKDVRFYELSNTPLEKALPQLLYKIYDSLETSMLLLFGEEGQVQVFNNLLWTFSSNKFLPHGIESDGAGNIEPLLLTTKEENLNKANILVSTKLPANEEFSASFSRKIYMFPKEQNEQFISKFQQLRNNQENATYWQQDASGKWHDV